MVEDTPTAEEITQHMVACGHSVLKIDGIKLGTEFESLANGFTQEEITDCVDRNVEHLKVQQAKQWYIDDSVSRSGNDGKEKHTAAITTGEGYIEANSG
jgi:hypothetical protein